MTGLFGSLMEERHWNFGGIGRCVLAESADGNLRRERRCQRIAAEAGRAGRRKRRRHWRSVFPFMVEGFALGGQDALDAGLVLVDDLFHLLKDRRVVIQLDVDVVEQFSHQFRRRTPRFRRLAAIAHRRPEVAASAVRRR